MTYPIYDLPSQMQPLADGLPEMAYQPTMTYQDRRMQEDHCHMRPKTYLARCFQLEHACKHSRKAEALHHRLPSMHLLNMATQFCSPPPLTGILREHICLIPFSGHLSKETSPHLVTTFLSTVLIRQSHWFVVVVHR